MNIDSAFPSNYLKNSDLDGDTVFTIRSIKVETLGRGNQQESKPVLYFDETDKGLALNKTNANTIKSLYGPDTDQWIGRKLTLFVTEVEYAGEQVLAIRVRMRAPASAPPQQPGGGSMAAAAMQQAKARAWAKWQEAYKANVPNGTADTCAAEWKESLAAYFPGKPIPGGISAAEWDKFVADGFTRPGSPISDEPVMDESSIPF